MEHWVSYSIGTPGLRVASKKQINITVPWFSGFGSSLGTTQCYVRKTDILITLFVAISPSGCDFGGGILFIRLFSLFC
jgi:hypothetical protein